MINTSVLAKWHEIIRQKNIDGLNGLLADDVVFFTPVVHKPLFGKKATILYFSGALKVFFNETHHYVREIAGTHDAALEFEVLVDGIPINGAEWIKWNDRGKIIELKVMLRPVKSVNLVHKNMGKILKTHK